jgi:hypothetical protein
MPTPTKDLRAFVGKQVRVERDGVIHKGVPMGEVYLHVRGSKIARKRWVLFTVDDKGNGSETHFKANDGWTVTLLRGRIRATSRVD